MGTALAVAAILAVVFGALLGSVWLVTRNPALERRLRAVSTEAEQQRALIGALHAEAQHSADVNPVAQVFLDEIARAGMAPVRRKEK